MIFLLSFFVGYFCLSYGQSPAPDIVVSTAVPLPASDSATADVPTTIKITPNPETETSPFAVLLPVVIGLRVSVKSTVELNFVTIKPFLQQIVNLLSPYHGPFQITVKNISRITPT